VQLDLQRQILVPIDNICTCSIRIAQGSTRNSFDVGRLTLCAKRSCWRFRPDPNREKELEETAEAREAEVIARCMVVENTERRMKDGAKVDERRVEGEQTNAG
jgi:hypothetical protein